MTKQPKVNKGVSIEEKRQQYQPIDPGFSPDVYGLDPELKKELDDQGLYPRFVNFREVERYGGYHPKGWRIYKRKNAVKTDSDWVYGRDPNGYVRRGDDILAVKTKEDAAKHLAFRDQKAEAARVTHLMRKHKEEQRRAFLEAGMDNHARMIEDDD